MAMREMATFDRVGGCSQGMHARRLLVIDLSCAARDPKAQNS